MLVHSTIVPCTLNNVFWDSVWKKYHSEARPPTTSFYPKWMFMAKLETLENGDCNGGAESAVNWRMAMGYYFNDTRAGMHHSWD